MAIVAGDLHVRHSTKVGAAGNSNAGTPGGSLGKYISTTDVTDATLHNLFDKVTGDENAAGDTEYRCVFLYNAHGSITLESVVAWISAQVALGADIAIGVDPTAASAIGSASAQAVEVVDENTAPAGVSFSTVTTKATGIAMGDIAAGFCRALWIRRSVSAAVALDADGATIRFEGDTAA